MALRSNSMRRTKSEGESKFIVGVCAMDKKAQSKPMKEILGRLPSNEFEVVSFGDDMILNEPIQHWPICHILISFFSSGFPLEKAQEYVKLRNPVLVNDLEKQHLLMDRRDVYRVLEENGVPVPRHVFVNRDVPNAPDPIIIEEENYLQVNDVRINKPFVEKPVDGEDHNIHIYYPMSAGGGCKRLFRKVGSRSSEYDPSQNKIRRNGSYIYEEFLSTQGTDVKVYTVGPKYAHAEARKSPVLDGRVLRDSNGKEVRYPVILSTAEKEIARKVCLAFEQTVCGFDILRVPEGSLVCDVNGWSFVKNSSKYYDDCAMLLKKFIISALNPDHRNSRTSSLDLTDDDLDSYNDLDERKPDHGEELRCVIAVIRHGDRTPKQKLKMKVSQKLILDFYQQRVSSCRDDHKIKAVGELEELLSIAKELLSTYTEEQKTQDDVKGLETVCDVLQRWKLCGINRKVQLKPRKWQIQDGIEVPVELLLILKWGGDLTHSGIAQAECLGQRFRHELYPSGQTGGLLRLHSTYRHDLKIYTSDEGRVQKTAAAFAKGFLELDGDLIPILVSLVLKGKDANNMLDQSGSSVHDTIVKIKQHLHHILHTNDLSDNVRSMVTPSRIESVYSALLAIEKPKEVMEKVHLLLHDLMTQIEQKANETSHHIAGLEEYGYDKTVLPKEGQPCGRETLQMMAERWRKLYKDFYNTKNDAFDLSKIPDIHDCIRYDAMHNAHLKLKGIRELLDISKLLADTLVPQEYGLDINEKLEIGTAMCKNLLKKIRDDLDLARGIVTYRFNPKFAKDMYIKSAHRSVRTRLYFTSESHIHTLSNVLRYSCGDIPTPITKAAELKISQIPELCYMTHIVFRLFERSEYPKDDPRRFRGEILFSPGSTGDPITDFSPEKPLDIEPLQLCTDDHLTCQTLEEYIRQAIDYNPVSNNSEYPNVTPTSAADNDLSSENKKKSGWFEYVPLAFIFIGFAVASASVGLNY